MEPTIRETRARGDAGGSSSLSQLTARLSSTMTSTIREHGLIRPDDRILVALSGGKDSYTLVDLLHRARRRAPFSFDLLVCHLDQGQPGYEGGALEDWLARSGWRYEILREDTYTPVLENARDRPGTTYCRVCSRLRRGILYTAARRHGCNKIALGHHRDDSIETLLLNLFYAGRLQGMPAIYRTNDDELDVIRPLIECSERTIEARAKLVGYPILPCNLCGSQSDLKRVAMKRLLEQLERDHPHLRSVMLSAMKNVRPSHLLDREVTEAWLDAAPRFPARR